LKTKPILVRYRPYRTVLRKFTLLKTENKLTKKQRSQTFGHMEHRPTQCKKIFPNMFAISTACIKKRIFLFRGVILMRRLNLIIYYQLPYVFGQPLFFIEIINFGVQKHVFRTAFVFRHPLFFTEKYIYTLSLISRVCL